MKPDYKITRRVVFEELIKPSASGSRGQFYEPEMSRRRWDCSASLMHRMSLVA